MAREQPAAQFNRLGTDYPTVFIDGDSPSLGPSMAAVYRDVSQQYNAIEYRDLLETFTSDTLEPLHQQHFERQETPTGQPWVEWQWRPFWGDWSQPTLHQSHTLRGSLRQSGTGNITDVGPHTLTFGTSIVYAGIHNFGATFTLGIPLLHRSRRGVKWPGSQITIPPREFLGMNEETVDELVEDAADWVVDHMGFGP